MTATIFGAFAIGLLALATFAQPAAARCPYVHSAARDVHAGSSAGALHARHAHATARTDRHHQRTAARAHSPEHWGE